MLHQDGGNLISGYLIRHVEITGPFPALEDARKVNEYVILKHVAWRRRELITTGFADSGSALPEKSLQPVWDVFI